MSYQVLITDYYYPDLKQEHDVFKDTAIAIIDGNGKCKTEEDLIKYARDADAIITQFVPITRKVIESLVNCQIIVRYAIGLDIIDLEAATEHGIMVANVPDYCLEEVATQTLALLLSVVRKVVPMNQGVRAGQWSYQKAEPLLRLSNMNLGLVAFGKIARLLVEMVKAFNFKNIFVYDPYYQEQANYPWVKFVSWEELLQKSDIVSVHSPATAETKHMFNQNVFKMMKDGSFFINTARGALVKEEDLVEALESGKLAGAGLDVLTEEIGTEDHPLFRFENVVITPHMGWYSVDSIAELQRKAAIQVKKALLGETVDYCVNK